MLYKKFLKALKPRISRRLSLESKFPGLPSCLGQGAWAGVLGREAWVGGPGPGGLGREAGAGGPGPGSLGWEAWSEGPGLGGPQRGDVL